LYLLFQSTDAVTDYRACLSKGVQQDIANCPAILKVYLFALVFPISTATDSVYPMYYGEEKTMLGEIRREVKEREKRSHIIMGPFFLSLHQD